MILKFLIPLSLSILLVSCDEDNPDFHIQKTDWSDKKAADLKSDVKSSFTYLPIYSSVYTASSDETRQATATVSIHNMNLKDSIFIIKADYYNNAGKLIRSYFDTPIYLSAMQTIDIVIHKKDEQGGTGANFLIEWKKTNPEANDPLIEAVMISILGQQGIAFTSRGVILDAPTQTN